MNAMSFIALYLQVVHFLRISTLVTTIPHFYGIRSFNTVFTKVFSVDHILIEINPFYRFVIYCFKIYFVLSLNGGLHLIDCLLSPAFLIDFYLFLTLHVCYIAYLSHRHFSDLSNNTLEKNTN
jgi:hypothetical protein